MIWGLIAILVVALGLFALISKGAPRGPRRRKSFHKGRPDRPMVTLDAAQIRDRWQQIEQTSQHGEHGLKQAVSDADKLLDQVLKQRGFKGETMADRLRSAQHLFSNKQNIWDAHKIRNAIAHEVNYDLPMNRGQKALADLYRGLSDLGAL